MQYKSRAKMLRDFPYPRMDWSFLALQWLCKQTRSLSPRKSEESEGMLDTFIGIWFGMDNLLNSQCGGSGEKGILAFHEHLFTRKPQL